MVFICCGFFTLLQSNYFDSAVTFSEQLFLQSLFFRTVNSLCSSYFFQNSYFFRETSTKQPPLENRKFFRVVTFRNSYLFVEGIVQNKDNHIRAIFSKQLLLHSINYFRRAAFQKKVNFSNNSIRHYPVFSGELPFLEWLLFQKILSSIVAIFSEELLFYNMLFQNSCYFTATLPFHSDTSYLSLGNYLIPITYS